MTEQLEIIAPTGAIDFFALDVARGVTAIGRAQSNDLRLVDGVNADYAALLDHRKQPFTLMALDAAADVHVNGAPLAEHAVVPLNLWDSVEIGSYVLILMEGGAGATAGMATPIAVAAAAPPLPPPTSPYAPPLAAAAAASVAAPALTAAVMTAAPVAAPPRAPSIVPLATADGVPAPMAILGPPILPVHSELIDLRLTDVVRTVDAGVPATWEVTVTNASTFVGEFEVHVAGYVLDKWISVAPETFTRSVRESAVVVITLHPDREPASLAGVHHFVIEVTSRSLHGAQQGHIVEKASVAAQLIINPFYDLNPSPVYPPETTLKYRQRTAALTLPIYNGGNSVIQAIVSGRDDNDDCRVEFPEAPPTFATGAALAAGAPAGNGAASNGAASNGTAATHTVIDVTSRQGGKRKVATFPDTQPVVLEPGRRVELPILVSPRQRRLVGGKPSVYRVSITTTPPQSLQALGVQPFVSQPRVIQETFIGRWIYLLLVLLVAIVAIFIFRPAVSDVRFRYTDTDGVLMTSQATTANSSTQTTGFIAGLRSRLTGGSAAAAAIAPDVTVRAGQPVTVTWATRNGQDLIIYAGDDTQARAADVTDRGVVRGGSEVLDAELAVSPDQSAQAQAANTGRLAKRFTLQVSNWINAVPLIGPLGIARRSFVIDVVPALAPSISSFTASSDQAIFGTPEALTWSALLPNPGDEVAIRERSGSSDVLLPPLPAAGTLVITPQADTRYDLVVSSRVWITSTPVPQSVSVAVRMPTPDIVRLSVAPAQVVSGHPITVTYDVQGSDARVLVIDRGIATEEFVLNSAADSIAVPVQTPGAFNVRLQAFRFPPGSTNRDDPATGSNKQSIAGSAATPTFTPTPTLPPTPTSTLSPTPTPIAPMIDVLALTPSEIVAGDGTEVLLTWQVIGDADQIQISAPDFSVTTADKKGSISVPRDKTRVFVLTVLYKGEAKASKSAELKVLEPTPTGTPVPPPPPTDTATPPPPTATAVPKPRILSFGIESVPPATKSIGSDGIDVYNVDGGAEMTIKWDVADATGADLYQFPTIGGNVPPITNRLPTDQVTMLAATDSRFEVRANNNPTGSLPADVVPITSRAIRIVINAAPQFDPPTNIGFAGGIVAGEPLTITWSYNPEQTNGILGFRVYRAPIGSNDFVRIANENVLNNLARQYSDKEGPFCDRSYFVVAVFLDLTRPGADKTVETDAGSTSFLTPPCP